MAQKGSAGERAAEYLFKKYNWAMFRTQPATRVIGRGQIINTGTGGIADYTGYDTATAQYRAAEVKEHSGHAMPCSRLTKKQRAWMADLPQKCAYVVILWTNASLCEMHPYKNSGSYRRGAGWS